MNEKFDLFLNTVDDGNKEFVSQLNQYLVSKGCYSEIKEAKSGYLVSYLLDNKKRTLASFVCRKSGIKLRIYPEHLENYSQFLEELPEKMKKEIKKSSICKRLVNPEDCNPRCKKGFVFTLDGEDYKKCRYMAFMPTLNKENNLYIQQFLEKELSYL